MTPLDLLAPGLLIVVLALVPLVLFFPRAARRRRWWCALYDREVDVELDESGPPGFRRAVRIRSCSAFDRPDRPTCQQGCLGTAFRRPWATTITRVGR